MPVYVAKNAKGELKEFVRKVEERDCLPEGWRRVFVPTRGFLKGAIEERSPEGAAPKGFQREENSGKNWREIERACGLSRDEIRRTWDF
jgi:hypothetical protein